MFLSVVFFCCIDLAEIAYANAIAAKVANAVTHNSMIDAAGKNGRIDLAEKAYANAIAAKVADAVTHNRMIFAEGKNSRIDLAEKAYANAIAANVADTVTHKSMIDALVLNNRLEEAMEIYKKIRIKHSTNSDVIDLHGFSYGSAYLALKGLIEDTKKPFKVTIIYGKGLHSKNSNDEHSIKKSVKQLTKDIQENYDISLADDPTNSGRALCHVKLKLMQKPGQDSISKNTNAGLFKPQKNCLSSAAPEFTPRNNNEKEKAAKSKLSRMNVNAVAFTPKPPGTYVP